MFSKRNLDNFNLYEDKANAHAGIPFCGVFQFAIPTSRSVFGRIGQGQQPLWGVGRLRLSYKGCREPRFDKRDDSRLFCILKNRCSSLLVGLAL